MEKKSNFKKMPSSGKPRLKNGLSDRINPLSPVKTGEVDALVISNRKDVEQQLRNSFEEAKKRVVKRTAKLQETNNALRESEERYRTIASNTPDHILIQNRDLQYQLVVNPQLGLTEKDMIGKTDHDILTKDDADAIAKIKKRVIETDTPVHLELPIADLEGNRQFFNGSYIPKHDAQGRVDGLVGYFRNVTAQKLADEALKESEKRYRDLFNSLIEGYCIIEMVFDAGGKPVDYRFLEVNEAFESQIGLRDAQGKLMRDLAPDHEQHWFDIYGRIALTGKAEHFVNEAKALNRWFDVQAFRLGGQESKKVVICFSDITQRKNAEDALRESEERYRLLVKLAPAGIYEVDFTTGKFTEVNDVMCSLLGYTHEELLAVTAFDILDDEGKAHFSSRIREARSGKRLDETVEYRVRKKDGGFIWGLLNSRFKLKDGNITGASVIAYDITERKKAEEEIRRHAEELRKSNQELERFNRAMVDRELRMVELKKQINELCAKLGEPPRFAADFDDE